MLKRQRVSSPLPPPSSSVPQDVSSEGIIDIRHKRRRVTPPSLDGQTRGWNQPSNPNSVGEEHEEEEYVEEDVQNGNNEAEFTQSPTASPNGEYTSVNSVLREMHILQKHRQMFSEPVTPFPDTPQDYPLRSELDKTRLSYHPERMEESARVYEHYEGTNKFLASAFLSRRQRFTGQP